MMINPYQTSLFESSAFDMTSLTTSINLLPNMYGKLESLKLFPQKSVRTRNISVEEQNGVLSLLPTQAPEALLLWGLAENANCDRSRFRIFPILVEQICPTNNPKNPSTIRTDHAITIPMAKEL